MLVAKHFKIQELVPEHVFKERGDKAWELIDERAIITLDALREAVGPLIINNWCWGGPRQWSGLRTEQSPYGSMYSQHRFGRAFDCISTKKSADEIRAFVLKNPELFPHMRGVELKVSWFHFDVGNRRGEGIFTFSP